MLGIIITGHGRFASGLYQAACQIVGEQPALQTVDFPEGMSTEQLAIQLQDAMQACDQGDGIIFITDILGGSPFRCAALLSMQQAANEVITGSNLPMLLELLLGRDEPGSVPIHDWLTECGRNAVTSLWHQTHKPREIKDDNDGI